MALVRPRGGAATPLLIHQKENKMKVVFAVLMCCLFINIAYGQVVYTVEVTTELDGDGVAINYTVVPDTGWNWKMDPDVPTERDLLERKPAPFAMSSSLIINYVVDVPPDQSPPESGAWFTMIVDLSSVGIQLPTNSSYRMRCWIRYKFTGVDPCEPSPIVLEKRQAGKGVVTPG